MRLGTSAFWWALAVPAPAQTKTIELTKPVAAGTQAFTQIVALRELGDGRVIVVDFQDKAVHLVDRQLAPIKRIGREGKGPGEYAMPLGLVPMAGDVTYLVDLMSQRFLPIKPDGSTGEVIAFTTIAKGLLLMAPPVADGRGRLFFQAAPADISRFNADSVPILRADPATKRVDTVAHFRPQKLNLSVSGGKVSMGAFRMFSAEEAWTATADGRVARVVPEPYHLVLYEEKGKPTAGPSISYPPIKVTDEEKAESKKTWEKGMGAAKSAMAAAGGRSAAGNFSAAEPEFAPTKPPFPDRTSALAGPNGEVWVARSRPWNDKRGLYDRFDRAGKVIGQVRLNPDSRVIGFGRKAVYVTRKDADDLLYLERYDW